MIFVRVNESREEGFLRLGAATGCWPIVLRESRRRRQDDYPYREVFHSLAVPLAKPGSFRIIPVEAIEPKKNKYAGRTNQKQHY